MIAFVEGKVLESTAGQCVLVVDQQHGRLGYQIAHPARSHYQTRLESALESGAQVGMWIHTHARSDQNGVWELFGFFDGVEREIFRSLLTVTGVGPKLALGLLTGLEPSELTQAVVEKSIERLTAISGVGKKTAERLSLELSEKWRDKFAGLGKSLGHAKAAHSVQFEDIRLALSGLGYRSADIDHMLSQVMQDVDAEQARALRTEDWIRRALKVTKR